MENITNNEIKNLLSNLCCSRCKNEFTKDSIVKIDSIKDILICHLECKKCGKDFGQIVFNINKNSKKHSPLEIIEGPVPISYDDVINAHEFIKKNL